MWDEVYQSRYGFWRPHVLDDVIRNVLLNSTSIYITKCWRKYHIDSGYFPFLATRSVYFMYDRKLLAKLSSCAWKVLSSYLKESVTVDSQVTERLAQYIVRAPNSQARMTYIPSEHLDEMASKNGLGRETFEAIDWLAKLITYIPNKGEQLVRYYGWYSNKSRGVRKIKMNRNDCQNLCDMVVFSGKVM